MDLYNFRNNHDLGLIIRLFFTWIIIVLYQDQIRKCIQPKSNFTKTKKKTNWVISVNSALIGLFKSFEYFPDISRIYLGIRYILVYRTKHRILYIDYSYPYLSVTTKTRPAVWTRTSAVMCRQLHPDDNRSMIWYENQNRTFFKYRSFLSDISFDFGNFKIQGESLWTYVGYVRLGNNPVTRASGHPRSG